jgi:hypothetical protein
VDLKALLSTEVHPLESKATRLIMSATPKERVKFLNELDSHYQSQNLYERFTNLWETPKNKWNKKCEEEYNACDEQHIIGMLSAEKKTCKEKRFAWSPTYSKAVEEKEFWKIALSLKRNHSRPNDRIRKWAEKFEIYDLTSMSTSDINVKLRVAQNNLREIKR